MHMQKGWYGLTNKSGQKCVLCARGLWLLDIGTEQIAPTDCWKTNDGRSGWPRVGANSGTDLAIPTGQSQGCGDVDARHNTRVTMMTFCEWTERAGQKLRSQQHHHTERQNIEQGIRSQAEGLAEGQDAGGSPRESGRDTANTHAHHWYAGGSSSSSVRPSKSCNVTAHQHRRTRQGARARGDRGHMQRETCFQAGDDQATIAFGSFGALFCDHHHHHHHPRCRCRGRGCRRGLARCSGHLPPAPSDRKRVR